MRVGTSGDYPPYSASTGDGTLRGFDVESAQAWARDRGHRLELIAFRWPELESRLENGDFDVAMSGVTVRGDRLARSPMSSAVARTEAVLVTRAGAPRFDPSKGGAGLVVAVNRGGHMERVARASLPRADIRPNDDNRSLADLLARGAVDAVVVDAAELASFYPDPEGQMPPIAAVLSRDRKAWWVSRKDPALADDLDAWITTREDDGTLPALRVRWGIEPHDAPDAKSRLADLVGRRLMLMPLVAEAKRRAGLPVEDPARERTLEAAALAEARQLGIAEEPYRRFLREQIAAAKSVQRATLGAGPAVPAATSPGDGTGAAAPPPPDLASDLRPAIEGIDAAIRDELARSAPLGEPSRTILSAIEQDARVTGIARGDLRRLADALAGIPAASPAPSPAPVSAPTQGSGPAPAAGHGPSAAGPPAAAAPVDAGAPMR
ncbi:MAG: transporter substrate-binding domain-containing protein [Alphaproteobacteria bacterium]